MLETMTLIGLCVEVAAVAVVTIVAGSSLARRRASRPARWLCAAMGAGLVGVFGLVLLQRAGDGVLADATFGGALANASFAIVPAMVFGFGREYHPLAPWIDRTVAVVAGTLVGISIGIPVLAAATTPAAWWHDAMQVAIGLEALVLTTFVSLRLVRDARDIRSPVVRARMHLLAVAMGVLVLAYVLSAVGHQAAEALLGFVVAAAALLTMVAFAPTSGMRARWRRRLDHQVETVVLRLMAAAHSREVTDIALPMIVDICGARRVTLRDVTGRELASSLPDGTVRHLAVGPAGTATYEVTCAFGTIEVETDAYTPIFGADEQKLVHMLGSYAGLALERCATLERR